MSFFKDNGLSIVTFSLFVIFLLGMSIAGFYTYNEDQQQHGEEQVSYWKYLTTGHFIESVFENWESQYLQLGTFALFSIVLFQVGSAESKDPHKKEEVDKDPRYSKKRNAPWAVRQKGWVLKVYEHSLSLAMLSLFLIFFLLHAWGGMMNYNENQREHGQPEISYGAYLTNAQFWFESLQNWQSEYLALFSYIVLTIFLRDKGSAESKRVSAPHKETGK
jgi:hypothetical protein